MSKELNHDEWEKLRSRADSLAHAVFLIAGGALSLSITVMINTKGKDLITECISTITVNAWYCLLLSIILFSLVKAHLIFQVFLLHVKPELANKHIVLLNGIGWILGILGLASFIIGLIQMVIAASMIVSN